MRNSLRRFLESLKHPQHNYKPSIFVFPELNLKKIKNDLDLENLGKQRGEKNEPLMDTEALDDVEHRIITLIDSEKKRCHELLLDELNTYSKRLHASQPEGYYSKIEITSKDAVAEFKTEGHQGLDDTYQKRRRVIEVEREVRDFRRKNDINRTVDNRDSLVWQVSLVVGLFLIESVLNGNFLAKGSEYGMLGGFIDAVGIAFMNIVVGLIVGRKIAPWAFHRKPAIKFVAMAGIAVYVVVAIGFNFFVAHYRDALGGDFPEMAGKVAFSSFKETPLGIADFQSWMMVGVGLLFSGIAAYDGLSMDDPYPGYGRLERKRTSILSGYIEQKNGRIENLRSTKDDAVAAMQEAQRDLENRRGESLAILDGRARLVQRFQGHMNYLEQCANDLLAAYRQANRQSRSTLPPRHFSHAWILEKPPPPNDQVGHNQKWIESETSQTRQVLSQLIAEVHQAYDIAVTRYQQIDKLSFEELRSDANL